MELPTNINRFGMRLISNLLDDHKDQLDRIPNTILSPLGLYLLLSMAYFGGRGKTGTEIASALGFSGDEKSVLLDEILRIQNSAIRNGEGIQTILANSLWAKQGAGVLPEFEQICRTRFLAEIQTLDFASAQAVNTINDWVSGKTNRKIDQILQKIPSNAVLFLINALYFKGVWKKPFDSADTRPGEFSGLDGKVLEVPLMHQTGSYAYAQTEAYQAVSLPYANESVSLVIFLPALGDGDIHKSVTQFQAQASNLDWESLSASFHRREGNISIPRFNVSSNIHLKQTLQALGMRDAFNGQDADFSGMVENPSGLYISDVLHKTCFEVNEEGSEAAAASKIELVSKTAIRRFSFHLNRPFFCVLRDQQTGTALFMGWIVNPA